MKQIIVGIDFSNSSLVALRLAIDIANRTGADILMLWVQTKEMDKDEAEQKLILLAKENEGNLNGKNISYIISQGKVYQAMSNLSKLENPDLIVIGAHGKGGYDEKYAGQNAFKVVTESNIPVLIVRENFNFNKNLEKIVLPIDSTKDTRQKVPWTIEFAKMFPHSQVNILGVQTSTIPDIRHDVVSYVLSVDNFLTQHNVAHTEHYVNSRNITDSTIEYAKEINADLIVITTEQEKTLNNLFFLGPYAQQMINLSPFPVLVVPIKQLHGAAK
jgi:nucleotide-binding universal stress UspA family protein